jgi:hypothetical protein
MGWLPEAYVAPAVRDLGEAVRHRVKLGRAVLVV